MPNISVIIVNWNTKELLINCLNSLFSDRFDGEYEVWVVDNDSSDGSLEEVRKLFPTVNNISTTKNIGFGAANNLAIRQSKGDYIWLLNPDTKVKPGATSELVKFMNANPSAGAAGSQLLNTDGSLQYSCYPFPTLSREVWRLFHLDILWAYGIYNQKQWNLKEPIEVNVIQGASLILRREALDQVGIFDEDYFMFTEEVDLCYRLYKAGWRLYWVPQSEVVHYGGQSTQQNATEMFISLYQTKVLFFRKHHSWLSFQFYKFTLSIASIARLLLIPLVPLESPANRRKHINIAKNYGRLLIEIWNF